MLGWVLSLKFVLVFEWKLPSGSVFGLRLAFGLRLVFVSVFAWVFE